MIAHSFFFPLTGQAGAEDPYNSCFSENDDRLKSWKASSTITFRLGLVFSEPARCGIGIHARRM